jgi:hypothetical protein
LGRLFTEVQGEFQVPVHRLDETGRADLLSLRVSQGDLDVRAFLERRHLDVYQHAAGVVVRFGLEGEDLRFLGRDAAQVVLG